MKKIVNGGGNNRKKFNALGLKALRSLAPLVVAAFLTPIAVGSLASAQNTYADTEVGANVTRPAFVLYVTADPTVTLSLVSMSSGVMSVGSSTVTTGTTSPSGYKLYIGMTGTSNSLINTTDSSKVITSSGTFTNPVVLTNGTWGYAIAHEATSVLPTNGFEDSYSVISSATPTDGTFAAIPISTSPAQKIAQTYATGSQELEVFFGARVGYETATGAYTNTVLYTAIADDTPTHDISVAPTTVDNDGGHTITVATPLFTTVSNFERHVYQLTADEYAAVTRATNPVPVTDYSAHEMTCSTLTTDALTMTCTSLAGTAGTHYIYVDIPYFSENYSTALTLHASDITGITTMQEMTSAICTNTTTGTTTSLTDTRDQKSYTIRKHEDGNCWMTQNLALGSTTADLTLTPSDSNITSGSFIIPTTAVQTSGSTSWGDASNSSNAKHVYATGNTTYGNYYNWYTATAGTGLGTMSSTSASSLTNATDSICPKGWRLPDGGTSATKSWYALDVALGGTGVNRTDTTQRNKFISSPYNFPYSGNYDYGGGVYLQGSYGIWWSRSAYTTAGQACLFHLDTNGYVLPQDYNLVGYGFAVRCVGK